MRGTELSITFVMYLATSPDVKKSEMVVSAHLVQKYSIHWPSYIEELYNCLNRIVPRLLACRLDSLFDASQYNGKAEGIIKPRPPMIGLKRSMLDDIVVKSKKQKTTNVEAAREKRRREEGEEEDRVLKQARVFGASVAQRDKVLPTRKKLLTKKERIKEIASGNDTMKSFT